MHGGALGSMDTARELCIKQDDLKQNAKHPYAFVVLFHPSGGTHSSVMEAFISLNSDLPTPI